MGEQSRNRGAQRDTARVDVARARGPKGTQRDTVPVAPRQRGRGGQRETVRVRTRRRTVGSVFTSGAVSVVVSVLITGAPLIVAVLVAWFVAGHPGTTTDAMRAAGAAWLLGHGVPVGIGGGLLGLTPLLITFLLVWRVYRAGAITARAIGARDSAAIRSVLLAVVPPYTLVATAIAVFVNGGLFQVSVARSALHAGAFAVVFAGLGALGYSGVGRRRWLGMPVWLRRGASAGLIAALIMLAGGAVAVGVALAANGKAARQMLEAYGTGAIGVGLVCLLFVPTVAIWATSYLLGPGFAFGTGTRVSLVDVVLGPVPNVPLLAAFPTQPAPGYATFVLGLPVVAGVVLGVFLARRSGDLRVGKLLLAALTAGIAAGTVIAVACLAATGPMGTGRLAEIGPQVWLSALAAAGTVTVAAGVGTLATRALLGRDRKLR